MKGLAWVVAAFVVTRSAILLVPSFASDVPIYAGYAMEFEAAQRIGMSFYEFRALPASEKQRRAAAVSQQIAPRDGTVFEYPPLALGPMLLPRMAWKAIRGPGSDCTLKEYVAVYRLEMAIVDALLFSGLAWLLRRVYRDETPRATASRLMVYVCGGALLPHLIYDRLDLLFAALLTAALGLLLFARRTSALLALAVSTAFKVVSLPLAPLWAIGSLPTPAATRPTEHFKNLLRLAAYGAALLTAIAVCLAPSYSSGGLKCLAFLDYHNERGIQLESTYASLLFAARLLGAPLQVVNSHGSADVQNHLAAILAKLSGPLVMLFAVSLAALYYVRASRRGLAPLGATLAVAAPRLAIQMITASLAALLLTSKVLSPQYLLWLLPLVCMLPGASGQRRLMGAVFLLLCLLSLLTFPILFSTIVPGFSPGAQPTVLAWVGVALLAIRNAGLAALLILILRTAPDEA